MTRIGGRFGRNDLSSGCLRRIEGRYSGEVGSIYSDHDCGTYSKYFWITHEAPKTFPQSTISSVVLSK
jgi:hypothetical protein